MPELVPLPAILALAGVQGAAIILQVFGVQPLEILIQVVEDLLQLLGLEGVPREAKTERTGLILAASRNERVRQLGIAIYVGARLFGRVLSSQFDNTHFLRPAIEQTIRAQRMTPGEEALLIRIIFATPFPDFVRLLDDMIRRRCGQFTCDETQSNKECCR